MANSELLPTNSHFYDYCLKDEKCLQKLLDGLLDPHQSLSETIEKYLATIKSYLSPGQSFEEFCKEVQKYNNNTLCGHVWTDATISYRCRTCAKNPSMSLCSDCFHGGNHDGHDANMFRSIGGGICDCGDVTVMNAKGFCKQHGDNQIPKQQIPNELIRTAQIILPRLILRLIQHLRSHASSIQSDTYSNVEEFSSLAPLFDFFNTLCNTGSSVCSILTNCLLNTDLYKQFNNQLPIDDLSNIYLEELNKTSSLYIPITLRTDNLSVYFDIKQSQCLLDEFIFWLIKYQFPECLLKFFLLLLTDLNFKYSFTHSFLNLYGMIIQQLLTSRTSRSKINTLRFVHISIQLFSNNDITIQAIQKYDLIEMILSSLYAIFSKILVNCQLQNSNENYHLVIAERDFSKNMYYWPILSDFINVLAHEYASRELLSEKRFLMTWINIIKWFQGMNVNHQEIQSDVFIQTNTNYLFAFTVETECCAMALWTIAGHIISPDFLEITSKVINRLFMTVQEWLSAIGFEQYTDINRNQVTYHLPLHRYISILTYVSINYQNSQLRNLFPIDNERFLLNLGIFPLRIQVVKYEILTNQIWTYYSYEMQAQSNMYSDSRGNLCTYMNDADIYLLQLISTLVNINSFMKMFFQSFYVSEWLVQDSKLNLSPEKSSYITLLEGSLIVLATIVVFSPHLALDDFERRRAEMISALAIQNCSYSYLDEHIAQPKGLSTTKHDIQSTLDDIAEYIAPTIEMTNGPKQGQYKLKDFVWEEEFDPLHVLIRISRRDLFETTMQRYTNWAKSANKCSSEKNLWPPYRLHKPKDQLQTNIRCILQSRYLHGILFSICYWMINETVINEDILSLVVYLCELTIDDQFRRLKYGQFANGCVPSTIEPSQCPNNAGLTHSNSLETLTLLKEERNVDEQQQSESFELPTETGLNYPNISCDTINREEPLDLTHIQCSHLQIPFNKQELNLLERVTQIEQCYASRFKAIKFDQISELEQQIQKQWDDVIMAKDASQQHNLMSYSKPSYDLENQFIPTNSSNTYKDQNNNSIEEEENGEIVKPTLKDREKPIKGVIDGKYETYYELDDFLTNAYTIIEKISFEQLVLNAENDTSEILLEGKPGEEINCTNLHLDQSPMNFNTISIQTNSKTIIESKSINTSLVQMLVRLLDKILSNTNSSKSSLNQLFDTIRMKKKSEQIGDGTFYLTRLLTKLEKLCEQCKIQINETVKQLDEEKATNNIDNINQKDKIKAMQEKIFEEIAKKQQKLLTASNDEHEEILSTEDQHRNIECCICQSTDEQNPLGLLVRLVDTGVLGVREINQSLDDSIYVTDNTTDNGESSFTDSITCCHLHSKQMDKQSLSVNDKTIEVENIYNKFQDKNRLTCAQFYEERIRSMLNMFSEKSVSESTTNSWRTGIIINSCGHSIHLSCYKQYLKSCFKNLPSPTEPYIEFKCPMCRQISNALIPIPPNDKQIESNEKIIETITKLIEKNTKSCISAPIAEWLIDFIQKMYSMIDKQEKELNDDILALFLVSTLRFNLENDLLVRDTEHTGTRTINRKICFRELFYICNLKYPYLLNNSHISLWRRITGITKEKAFEQNNDIQSVPLLLSDPVGLLLRLMLSLPFSITKEFYRVIVQALFNLTYIQALLTIVTEMNKNEQDMWANILTNQSQTPNSKPLITYIRIISFKLSQTNFNSNIEDSKVLSLESINALIRERCRNFIEIAALIQHHLYQPITWWSPSHLLPFDILWNDLLKELQLYDVGEPYWFCTDPLSLIINWLDEVLLINKQDSIFKIIRPIPSFSSPRFIELPLCYSDLFRLCTHLRCPHCQKLITDPILCLICGIVHPQERFEQKCCDQQTRSIKEHLMNCSGGLNLSIDINSTKTLIQRERRYTYWSSLYLDQHGEEDLHLRRGRTLYLDKNRLDLLYSAWISSNLDQVTVRWSTDEFDF